MKMETWLKLMRIGAKTGCHQRADRSFSLQGWQFPVCARCTGVLLGQFIALFSFWFYRPSWLLLGLFCALMLVDWLVQRLGWRESTNWRRLLTGIVGGYGLLGLELALLLKLIYFFK
ncbi:MAG: DUF2085 domain-containing protein [Clostridia bacterium]|nr:DUF2085 domain-containing protein [Clostridia bacterium]